MKGTINQLTQNLVKISNDRDKERIILRKGSKCENLDNNIRSLCILYQNQYASRRTES